MFAVFGSGFGLYGYLPALVRNGERVVLPGRYRERFLSRPELAPFAGAVTWTRDEQDALAAAGGAAIVLRPEDQFKWIEACAGLPNVKHLLLEKPLAPTPELAGRTLDSLERAGKNFRIGYTLLLTPWASRLAHELKGTYSGALSIDWTFMAHHHRHNVQNWKRTHSQGGGGLRFYGIHLIALLAGCGYRSVERSEISMGAPDECDAWEATFAGPGLPACRVKVNTRSEAEKFAITFHPAAQPARPIFAAGDPFETPDTATALDRRVAFLSRHHSDLAAQTKPPSEHYREVNRLWQEVEKNNR